jgi:MoaA/NifB/PqqE/SkfB family radical SAM enzyme
MIKPTRIQLEINGACSGRCKTCLPPDMKTNQKLSYDAIYKLACEWRAFGIEAITLAGFGSAAEHPDICNIIQLLASRLKFRVCTVCRPGDLALVCGSDTVILSVQNAEDAKDASRYRYMNMLFRPTLPGPRIQTHTVMDPGLPGELPRMLKLLENDPQISRINFAHVVALCDDEEHLKAVSEANVCVPEVLKILGPKANSPDSRITQQLTGYYPEKCAFHKDLIYVDAGLKIRQCCHLPSGEPLGDLRTQTLREAIESPKYQMIVRDWIGLATCRNCPDVGA